MVLRIMEDTSANRAIMEQRLRTGGYHIYTTLDPDIQGAVQNAVSGWEFFRISEGRRFHGTEFDFDVDPNSFIRSLF